MLSVLFMAGCDKEDDKEEDILQMTLLDAINRGYVQFSAYGSSISSSVIEIYKKSDSKLILSIDPGLYLAAESSDDQSMIITGSTQIKMIDETIQEIYVNTACMNIHRNIPTGNSKFALKQLPENDLLTKVIKLLNRVSYSYAVIQAAVWIVTDEASYADVGVLQNTSRQRVIDTESYNKAVSIVNEARNK
ncbi:MAG: hypothetical protein LBN11_03230 [Tannerella sp.]|nr:hypothetical protein [Tannerella sp.]